MGEAPEPKEIKIERYVARYGAEAVLGRIFTAREIRDYEIAQSVVTLYRSRADAPNEARWADEHPEGEKILERAFMEYKKLCL